PVKTEGTAEGRMILRKIIGADRFSERADLTSMGSTLFTPAMVLSRIGKKQAKVTMPTFEASPMPGNRMNTGKSASAEGLRKNSSSGVRKVRTGVYQPMVSPSGTATATASEKPIAERVMLLAMWFCSSPVSTIFQKTATTWLSGGNQTSSTRPSRGSS